MTTSPSRTGLLTLSGKIRARIFTEVYDPFRPATTAELIAFDKFHNVNFSHIYNLYLPAPILPQIEPDQTPIHDELDIPQSQGLSITPLLEISQSIATYVLPCPSVELFAQAITNGTQPFPALTEAITASILLPRDASDPILEKMEEELLTWKLNTVSRHIPITDAHFILLGFVNRQYAALVKASFTRYYADESARMSSSNLNPLYATIPGGKGRIERVKTLYQSISKQGYAAIKQMLLHSKQCIELYQTKGLNEQIPAPGSDGDSALSILMQLIRNCDLDNPSPSTDATEVEMQLEEVAVSDTMAPGLGSSHSESTHTTPPSPPERSSAVESSTPSSSMDLEHTHSVLIKPVLNLQITPRARPVKPDSRSYAATAAAATTPCVRVAAEPAPIPAADMFTWKRDSADEIRETLRLRDSLRSQPESYYTYRHPLLSDVPTIDDTVAGDQIINTAQYGIIHRKYADQGMNAPTLADIQYILEQAGIPSEAVKPQGIANGIELDGQWMQLHNTRLALKRDCTQIWPPSDGVVFRIKAPIHCGATCILDSQGAPAIFGETQRILGSECTKAGHPKACILQWLPNPIAVEKLLDQRRWANLAVVRGLSQGFEDSAITTMGLYAVRDYLGKIGMHADNFALIYGSIWFTDNDAQPVKPTAAAKVALDAKPHRNPRQGTRIPELILRIVYTNTSDDCADCSQDAGYIDLRQQFHAMDTSLGPYSFRHWGFYLEVLASVEACVSRPWRRRDSMVDTQVTIIPGIAGNCLAKDIITLLYLASNTYTWEELFDICCAVIVPAQIGRNGSTSHAKCILIWHGQAGSVEKGILLPLKAAGHLGRYFDVVPSILPGLQTYIRAGVVAGRPPLHICERNPDIYPIDEPEVGLMGPVQDPDDIFADEARAPPVKVTYYGNTQAIVEKMRLDSGSGGQGPGSRGDRVELESRISRGGRHSSAGGGSEAVKAPPWGDVRRRTVGPSDSLATDTSGPSRKISRVPPDNISTSSLITSQRRSISAETASASPPAKIARGEVDTTVPMDTAVTCLAPASVSLASPDANIALLQLIQSQFAQTQDMLRNLSVQNVDSSRAAILHTDHAVMKSSLDARRRAIQETEEALGLERAQILRTRAVAGVPDWYLQTLDANLMDLNVRSGQAAAKKTALEQEYHLFNHAHENVAVRPSS